MICASEQSCIVDKKIYKAQIVVWNNVPDNM